MLRGVDEGVEQDDASGKCCNQQDGENGCCFRCILRRMDTARFECVRGLWQLFADVFLSHILILFMQSYNKKTIMAIGVWKIWDFLSNAMLLGRIAMQGAA